MRAMVAMMAMMVMMCAAAIGAGSPAFAQPRADAQVEEALAAARTRALSGDVIAQFSLGALLYYGGADTVHAVEWFQKAASAGFAPAEFQMGQLYDFGFGVAQNDAEALSWYRKAAEHGSAAAQRAVGSFFQKGRAVAASPEAAAQWYRRAAEGDDLRAQYELGQLYFTGSGVARDYPSAYFWFSLAAGQTPLVDNRKGLLELRNIAAARMTPDETEAAARRVAAWTPPAASRQ
jgi:TPR repeat protein